jgi:hypothetical protein
VTVRCQEKGETALDTDTLKSERLYARIAGAAYIVTMILGIFSVNYIESNLIVAGNDAATVTNISANLPLFRIGIASEILMYVLVVLLAFSLYTVLKSVDKNLALLALLWRMGEAILGGATTVLSGLIPIMLVERGSVFGPEQFQTLVKLFLDIRSAGLDIVLIFIGLGGTIFLYLFFKSKFVPKILAVWGMLTYLLMLLLSFTSILTPISETTKMAFYAPGGVFELIFGLWLLIKSVNVQQKTVVS